MDEAVKTKLKDIDIYINFLGHVIERTAKSKKFQNKEQLTKLKYLYSFLKNPESQLDLQTLRKCEVALTKLYKKYNHHKKIPKLKDNTKTKMPHVSGVELEPGELVSDDESKADVIYVADSEASDGESSDDIVFEYEEWNAKKSTTQPAPIRTIDICSSDEDDSDPKPGPSSAAHSVRVAKYETKNSKIESSDGKENKDPVISVLLEASLKDSSRSNYPDKSFKKEEEIKGLAGDKNNTEIDKNLETKGLEELNKMKVTMLRELGVFADLLEKPDSPIIVVEVEDEDQSPSTSMNMDVDLDFLGSMQIPEIPKEDEQMEQVLQKQNFLGFLPGAQNFPQPAVPNMLGPCQYPPSTVNLQYNNPTDTGSSTVPSVRFGVNPNDPRICSRLKLLQTKNANVKSNDKENESKDDLESRIPVSQSSQPRTYGEYKRKKMMQENIKNSAEEKKETIGCDQKIEQNNLPKALKNAVQKKSSNDQSADKKNNLLDLKGSDEGSKQNNSLDPISSDEDEITYCSNWKRKNNVITSDSGGTTDAFYSGDSTPRKTKKSRKSKKVPPAKKIKPNKPPKYTGELPAEKTEVSLDVFKNMMGEISIPQILEMFKTSVEPKKYNQIKKILLGEPTKALPDENKSDSNENKGQCRKRKTEIDRLHEYINESFIRDGVLTATGRRMCTKAIKFHDEDNNHTDSSDGCTTDEFDPDMYNENKAKKFKASTMRGTVGELTKRFNLDKRVIKICVPRLSVSDSIKVISSQELLTPLKTVPFKERKRRLSRVLTKALPKNTDKSNHCRCLNYDECALCSVKDANIVSHCVNYHPDSEVFVSRLPQKDVDFLTKNRYLAYMYESKGTTAYKSMCIFCKQESIIRLKSWYEHFSTHTGEFSYECTECGTLMATVEKMLHYCDKDPQKGYKITKVYRFDMNVKEVVAYLCDFCNYIQLFRENLMKHLRTEHDMSTNLDSYCRSIILFQITDTSEKSDVKVINEPISIKIENESCAVDFTANQDEVNLSDCDIKSETMRLNEFESGDESMNSLGIVTQLHVSMESLLKTKNTSEETARESSRTVENNSKIDQIVIKQEPGTSKDKDKEQPIACVSKEAKPTVDLPKATVDLPKPTVALPKPTVTLPKPTVILPKPTVALPKPTVDLPKPTVTLPKPIVDSSEDIKPNVNILQKQLAMAGKAENNSAAKSCGSIENKSNESTHQKIVETDRRTISEITHKQSADVEESNIFRSSDKNSTGGDKTNVSGLPHKNSGEYKPPNSEVPENEDVKPHIESLNWQLAKPQIKINKISEPKTCTDERNTVSKEHTLNVNKQEEIPLEKSKQSTTNTTTENKIPNDGFKISEVAEKCDTPLANEENKVKKPKKLDCLRKSAPNNEDILIISNIGFLKSSDDIIEYYCFVPNCQFIKTLKPRVLAEHVQKHKPRKGGSLWNNYCKTCIKNVKSDDESMGEFIHLIREHIPLKFELIDYARKFSIIPELEIPTKKVEKPHSNTLQCLKPWLSATISNKREDICRAQLCEDLLYVLYKCMGSNCAFSTHSKQTFVKHLSSHSGTSSEKSWFECAYCDFVADNSQSLVDHIDTEHKSCIFQCSKCFYRSFGAYNVKHHQLLEHSDTTGNTILVCSKEKNTIEMKTVLSQRSQIVRPFKCKVCNAEFFIKEAFINHMKIEQPQCDTTWLSKSLSNYACVYCKFDTLTLESMRIHIVRKHPNRMPYACERIPGDEAESEQNYITGSTVETTKLTYIGSLVDQSLLKECPKDLSDMPNLNVQISSAPALNGTFNINVQENPPIRPTIIKPVEAITNDSSAVNKLVTPSNDSSVDKISQNNSIQNKVSLLNIRKQFNMPGNLIGESANTSDLLFYLDILTFYTGYEGTTLYQFILNGGRYCLKNVSDLQIEVLQKCRRFQCLHCGVNCPGDKLKIHMELHKKHRYICYHCFESFSNVDQCNYHLKKKHHGKSGRAIVLKMENGIAKTKILDNVDSLDDYVLCMRSEVNPVIPEIVDNVLKRLKLMINIKNFLHNKFGTAMPTYVPTTQMFLCGFQDCTYRGVGHASLRTHILETHTTPSRFKCRNCQYGIESADKKSIISILDHMLMHDSIIYVCLSCKLSHWNKDIIEYHVREVHHSGTIFKEIRVCPGFAIGEPCIKEYIKISNQNSEHSYCRSCDVSFTSQELLESHMSIKHPDFIFYQCTACGFTRANTTLVVAHRKECHETIPCSIRMFYSSEQLNSFTERAQRQLTGIMYANLLSCDLCQFQADTRADIELHKKSNHFEAKISISEFPDVIVIEDEPEEAEPIPMVVPTAATVASTAATVASTAATVASSAMTVSSIAATVASAAATLAPTATTVAPTATTVAPTVATVAQPFEEAARRTGSIRVVPFERLKSVPPDTSTTNPVICNAQNQSINIVILNNQPAVSGGLVPYQNIQNQPVEVPSNTNPPTQLVIKPTPAQENLLATNNTEAVLVFICNQCNLVIFTYAQLLVHWKLLHNDGEHGAPFQFRIAKKLYCAYCPYTTIFERLRDHYTSQHPDEMFIPLDASNLNKCGLCPYTYSQYYEIIAHSVFHPSLADKNIKISIDFITNNLLDILFKLGHTSKVYKCSVCHRIFFHRTEYLSHAKNNADHSNPMSTYSSYMGNQILYGCSCCKYVYDDEKLVARHIRDHTAPHMCKYCDSRYKLYPQLLNHYREVHRVTEIGYVYVDPEVYRKYYSHMRMIFPNGLMVTRTELKNTVYGRIDDIINYMKSFEINELTERTGVEQFDVVRVM